jgi:hypothetical protein
LHEKKEKEMKKQDLKIVEGVAGVYHYHLSVTGENYQEAICGKREVMKTSLPLKSWGNKEGIFLFLTVRNAINFTRICSIFI